MKPKAAHVWERDPHDWYVEDRLCTLKLLAVEGFAGTIHDPCCGQGNIVTACIDAGYVATGTDLVERKPGATWFAGIADYKDGWPLRVGDNIISNPPFYRAKGLEDVTRCALAACPGKVAIFAPLPFLAGGKRGRGLWRETPPDRVWIFSDRPSCPPGEFLRSGGEAKGGNPDWCWLVWDERSGTTRLGWLI